MRARDRLVLVEREYPVVVAPDLVETLAPRHGSRYIPVLMARLLFVTGTSPNVRSGSGTFVGISVLCEALRAGGHTVELLAPRDAGGGPVSLPARLLFNLRARKAARGRCPDPDAVIGFDLDGLFLPRGRARRIAAIKGGAAEEASFERGPARVRLSVEAFFEKRHVRGADRILAPSAHTAGRIVSDYGVPSDRIAVVPEPIDLARWRAALAAAPDLPRGPVSILCVAHLYPRKDVATLLDAMARLAGGAVLRVVGTGPALAGLERRAREVGLGGRVEFLGHLPFDRLAAEYRRADLFCLPSRQEGFGIVFLEAMAAGLPVVAVRAAAIPEIVADGASGILVPPGDAAALANALERLIADPAQRRRLSEEGLRRVRRYDAPDVAAGFLEAIGLESAGERRLETRRWQS
jgi:phosphatidyl-myo-inositol dimannoside synthase